ncbi:Protein translocase subunit SecD [Candidatus Bandiella woodruffii]|uniref:Protein translocase subunit SecD n=1 Tax=Candidatus Bandiella euplotis TaxID=1664265 RepID=A0ABZ0UJB9_9RICK|nr:Protein translocase subunit SecD [Candidatus Bandiella woodruffii]
MIFAIITLSIYFAIPTFFYEVKTIPFFPAQKINFGLDLKGGVSLTIEADIEEYIKEKFSITAEKLKDKLAEEKIQFSDWQQDNNIIQFTLNSTDSNRNKVLKEICTLARTYDLQLKNSGNEISLAFDDLYKEKLTAEVIKQSMEIVTRRVDSIGTKEVEIQTIGKDMILLQVPGLNDPEEIKKVIGKTARLTFHIVKSSIGNNLSEEDRIALLINSKVLPIENVDGQKVGMLAVESIPSMTGDMLSFANADYGSMGESVIKFRLNSLGSNIFADVTTKNKGKMLAIVLDNKIISAPSIREPILSGEGVISGSFTPESASELALLLRAGALPVPLKIIEERVVGPTLGLESIIAGIKACILAAVLVLIIMVSYYRFFGIIANLALVINFVMMISVLAIFGATLTLPGIAGIVLTLGMAVDANVLIFERVKEELKKGRTPLHALHNGYKFAFATILDSNITSIAAGAVLYMFGSGPIKGFAVTLIVGILCSMFTSVTVTKVLVTIWYRARNPKTINI